MGQCVGLPELAIFCTSRVGLQFIMVWNRIFSKKVMYHVLLLRVSNNETVFPLAFMAKSLLQNPCCVKGELKFQEAVISWEHV